MELFAKDEALPDVKARVTRLEFGPPVGFPVQFRVIGPDKAVVRDIAYRVRDVVRGARWCATRSWTGTSRCAR